MQNPKKMIYYFTVSWDGIDELTEGSVTHMRESYKDAIEGIKYYMEKYKLRSPYPTGLSLTTIDQEYSENLLTDKLKHYLMEK